MIIEHPRSNGLHSFRAEYCTDCWTRWQNTRENLDGQSEYGVQNMSCPHCAMSLADSPAVYERKDLHFYEIRVENQLFQISTDTTLEELKAGIRGSSLNSPTRFDTEDVFDLYSEEDGILLTGSYLLVPPGTLLRIEPVVTILRVVRGPIRITLYSILNHQPSLVAILPAEGVLRDLKEYVRAQTGLSVEYQKYLHKSRILTEDDASSVADLEDGKTDDRVYLVRSLRGDIGEFDAQSVWQIPPRPLDVIQSVRDQRPEYQEGKPEFVTREQTILSESLCQTLCSRLDLEDQTLSLEGQTLDMDTKVRLTVADLQAFVGKETLCALLVLFGDSLPTEVILRRTRGTHGAPIPFHLDSALRTLQIPLNGQNEYTGGSTVFLLPEGPRGTTSIPCRRAGASFTLHNAHVVHGVSPVEAGFRDSLFLLQKDLE